MKVNDPNLASLASLPSSGANRAQETERAAQSTRLSPPPANAGSSDDVHLSELVRSLRSLAANSPERQSRLEQIARSVANGSYKTDAHATASKIVDDAIEH
jgi:flagellar biosynthesis anti-sigma factor FlgM